MDTKKKLAGAALIASAASTAVPFFWTGYGVEYALLPIGGFMILAVYLWIGTD